jgi:tight adherence protein C
MEEELGDVLELLRVAVEAGLTVARALGEVGRRHPGVLAAEIRRAAGLMELGRSQQLALEALVSRCPTPGVATLAAALRRAERHGAPLGDALAAQAEDARARRAREAIEVAARAAPKIQLIVALLLVPSAMLLMAAAMLPALAWR